MKREPDAFEVWICPACKSRRVYLHTKPMHDKNGKPVLQDGKCIYEGKVYCEACGIEEQFTDSGTLMFVPSKWKRFATFIEHGVHNKPKKHRRSR